ncbi:cytochrome b [Iodidimonas gelatinilytica]|uniref:Cytochrome b n=1 Tax=Iodidimonas gelatinilytica TaxID=1236966 RepID=A0A5A7MUY1_9PROT|nr:cytochrome b [Iodidimonas gelatinilytica]GEQ99830.1 cytochrome b [Iodidimonas gelatinilytica]
MQISNSQTRWGLVSIGFHWIVALLVIAMWGLGYSMSHLVSDLQTKFTLFQLHKSIGFTVFWLALLRLVWRVMTPGPMLPGGLTPVERDLAHLTHWGLYGLLLLMPLAGWVSTDTSELGIPTRIFKLFTLPTIFGPNDALHELSEEMHEVMAWALVALLVLHIGAALKHHFILKDDILRRMLPFGTKQSYGEQK